jgi:hypothetical protein
MLATQVKRGNRIKIGQRDYLVTRRYVTATGNVALVFADRPTKYCRPNQRVRCVLLPLHQKESGRKPDDTPKNLNEINNEAALSRPKRGFESPWGHQ